MAKRKRKEPAAPEAAETPEGVTVSYPDRVLPPAFAPLRRLRHCPACGEGPVRSAQRYGATSTAYLYECPRCVDPETCRPTRWKDPR